MILPRVWLSRTGKGGCRRFVGEAAVDLHLGQGELLLEENLGQQQAAAQDLDLLLQGLLVLAEVVQGVLRFPGSAGCAR